MEPRLQVADPAPDISETNSRKPDLSRATWSTAAAWPDSHSTLGIRAAQGDLQQKLSTSFFVPTFIVRALGRLGDPVNFSIVTRGLAQVSDEPIDPLRATSSDRSW